jgi:uncharacterized protein (TIGR02147 family)
MSLFKSLDYVDVVRAKIDENRGTYGYKGQLAKAGGFPASLLSQVLSGTAHISPDHALGLADFWRLRELEKEYFLLLVSLARAGTKRLREHLKARLDQLRKDSENLAKRLEKQDFTAEATKLAVYYSSWHFTAIHILLTIPDFQTPAAIAKKLGLDLPLVTDALQSLKDMGLAKRSEDRWVPTNSNLHLSRSSPFSRLHHRHWREKAIAAFNEKNTSLIPYSALYSLKRSEVESLKDLIFATIQKSRAFAESQERPDELVCVVFDLFYV